MRRALSRKYIPEQRAVPHWFGTGNMDELEIEVKIQYMLADRLNQSASTVEDYAIELKVAPQGAMSSRHPDHSVHLFAGVTLSNGVWLILYFASFLN